MDPAFRLRLPCIPVVPPLTSVMSSLTLVKNCHIDIPIIPIILPPPPPPPPPGMGCFASNVKTKVQPDVTFDLTVERTYPNLQETGICEPLFTITLKVPGGPHNPSNNTGGGGGSNPSHSHSSMSAQPRHTDLQCDSMDVLVDITCNPDDCTITKYYKKICYLACPCPEVGNDLELNTTGVWADFRQPTGFQQF
jgi:hypothetical protein